ncbi:hypothetical protein GFL91_15110 [Rhizobium leguminosarum bv. viciae]|uniref:Uncharacterized protein n=1 Tax=Rhizobium leguminosarum bv. viciae TaxID=387 RepID=A0A8I2KFL5_RHILV|nr:hypothetical protein [Rhizobium leguminosarum]NKM46288.1 hypothetical protein [Rhizobium leguminosarum bv. viciae]
MTGDALRIEAIRDEPGNCTIAFFRTLAAQACKATLRAKVISSSVDLCGFREEITGFSLHWDISSTDLPVEQCPEPRLRPLLLAGLLSHEYPAFCKNFKRFNCCAKKTGNIDGIEVEVSRLFSYAIEIKGEISLQSSGGRLKK